MVEFHTLLNKSEAENYRDTLEIAAFYLTVVENRDQFSCSELLEFLRSSRSAAGQHTSSYDFHEALQQSFFIVDLGNDKYTLSVEGKEQYSGLLKENTVITEANNIIDNNFEGDLYQNLVDNINRCYAIGAYQAIPILSRKLLENLLIDILRRRYGLTEEGIPRFYDEKHGQFRSFRDLLDTFRDNIEDFEHYSESLDASFIDDIERLKRRGMLPPILSRRLLFRKKSSHLAKNYGQSLIHSCG